MKKFKEWCLENNKHELLATYENADNEFKSDEIGFSSPKKVNWRCNKCGSKWIANTNKMKDRKYVCLYCKCKKPSDFYNLEIEIPILAKEWDYDKNLKKPTDYLPGSQQNVWWKCENGHEFEEKIKDRVVTAKRNISKGRPICPYCNHERISASYNLVTEFPDIAKQWNYRKNGSLTPFDVMNIV